jgi:plastocyanin
MQSWPRFQRVILFTVLLAWLIAACRAIAADGAAITGAVTYTADPQRPWRYARYYVADAKRGLLAESVVCLSQRGLKNFRPRETPQTVTMDQSDYRFVPETVAIRTGDQVRFTNSDPLLHNVMALGGAEPLNVSLVRDSEHVQVFRRAGNAKSPIKIGCSLHSQMQAWIFVFDHPFFAVTQADGKYRFDDVPPGEYTLELVHPAGGLSWRQPLTLTAGETKTIDIRVSPDNKN